mgnify:CR=1 FL=1
MTEKELGEFLKYSNSKELYIVDFENKLMLLKCPFMVVVLKDVDELKKEDIVVVDQVKVTYELITVYLIKDKAFFYFYFDIVQV